MIMDIEVGNVLFHYFDISHEVVDKYEKAPGVTSENILDFRPERRYDLIVYISILEHVGFDKPPRDTRKALLAFEVR